MAENFIGNNHPLSKLQQHEKLELVKYIFQRRGTHESVLDSGGKIKVPIDSFVNAFWEDILQLITGDIHEDPESEKLTYVQILRARFWIRKKGLSWENKLIHGNRMAL